MPPLPVGDGLPVDLHRMRFSAGVRRGLRHGGLRKPEK
jgi:hypothetical protein